MSHPKSHVSHILILGIFVGASMAWDPWIKEAHKACLAGKLNYQVRKRYKLRINIWQDFLVCSRRFV